MLRVSRNKCFINHSGKYVEINFNMEIPFSQLSSSFATSMEASFANIQSLIDDRLNSYVSQDVNNVSLSAPSPVPVYQVPSQGQTDPSLRKPHTGVGPGGETEEPGQDELATSSFFAALNAAGISVLQGVVISDWVARESSFGSGLSAVSQAGTPQSAQAEVPEGVATLESMLSASGSPVTEQVHLWGIHVRCFSAQGSLSCGVIRGRGTGVL